MSKRVHPSHTVGRQAVRILAAALPKDWLFRPEDQGSDYGVDATVEIVQDENPTGRRLFVQVRGTAALKMIGDVACLDVPVRDLEYLENHDLPAILVAVDVERQIIHWLNVHHYARDVLDAKGTEWRSQETVRVHFAGPAGSLSDLPEAWTRFAHEGPPEIAIGRHGIPDWGLTKRARSVLDGDGAALAREAAGAARLKGGADLDVAMEAYGRGERDLGLARLHKAWELAVESRDPELICRTGVALLWVMNPLDRGQNEQMARLAAYVSDVAGKAEIRAHYLMAQGLLLTTVGIHLLSQWVNTNMQIKVLREGRDVGIADLFESEARRQARLYVQTKLALAALIEDALEEREFTALADILRRTAILEDISSRYVRVVNRDADVTGPVDAALKHIQLATDIAEKVGDSDFERDVLISRAGIENFLVNSEAAAATLSRAAALARAAGHTGDVERIQRLLERLPKLREASQVRQQEGGWDDLSEDEKDEFIAHYIRNVMGVDLDANDDIARILKIGLKDRNPERALRHCQHLDVEAVSFGIPGRAAGLPSAGSKLLWCDAKKIGREGFQLDELLEQFRYGPCVACPHHSPRERDWRWTESWQLDRAKTRSTEFRQALRRS